MHIYRLIETFLVHFVIIIYVYTLNIINILVIIKLSSLFTKHDYFIYIQ